MARYVDPPGPLTGEHFRQEREARGWNRAQAAEFAGLKEGAVYRVEHKSQFRAGEYEALVTAYRLDAPEGSAVTGQADDQDLGDETGEAATEILERVDIPTGEVVERGEVHRTWRGLSEGDPVKLVDDEGGRCEFRFYYRSSTQEYVQVMRRPRTKISAGPTHIRPVHPSSVLRMNGERVVDDG